MCLAMSGTPHERTPRIGGELVTWSESAPGPITPAIRLCKSLTTGEVRAVYPMPDVTQAPAADWCSNSIFPLRIQPTLRKLGL